MGCLGFVQEGFFGNRKEGKHTEFLWCNIFVLLLLQHIRVEFTDEVSSKYKFRAPRAVLLFWEQTRH